MELPISEIIVTSYVAILSLMAWIVRMVLNTSANAKETARTLEKITVSAEKVPIHERILAEHHEWLQKHDTRLDAHGESIAAIKARCGKEHGV